jgi:hypothetical protein
MSVAVRRFKVSDDDDVEGEFQSGPPAPRRPKLRLASSGGAALERSRGPSPEGDAAFEGF